MIYCPEATSQSSGDWQNKKMCLGSGDIKTARLTVNSLSEAQESCKQGCDADNVCMFSYLNYGAKWCKHFDITCSISGQNTFDGHYVYTKSKYEDLSYLFVEIKLIFYINTFKHFG